MRTSEGHSEELTIGSVFADRYRIERRIAAGGMGAVYEVVHLETNRRRALKVMHADYVSSDELRARFRQEARVAAEIESEHIVDVFDAGVDVATSMPFLVMELLRGEELGRHSKRVGPLPKEDVVRYLYETSLALDKTHRARIVHRDLKPDNLFLCEREHGPPRVKVLDFGIAKIVKDFETKTNATRSLGTPLYMAPEQFQLTSPISPATDIFALGMITFTLLVGKPYWHAESAMASEVWAFVMHVATGPKESAVRRAWELFGVELPAAFDEWFFRATAREPTARFASAGEAIRELANSLDVRWPGAEFVTENAKLGTKPQTADPGERTNPSNPSGPNPTARRTGPTMLAMTAEEDPTGLARKRRRARPWIPMVVVLVTATLGLFGVLSFQLMKTRTVSAPLASQAAATIVSALPATTPSTTPPKAIEIQVKPYASNSAIAPVVPVAEATIGAAITSATSSSTSIHRDKSASAATTTRGSTPSIPPNASSTNTNKKTPKKVDW